MSEAGRLFLCFVRGLNVFGRGKISIPEQQARCSSAFDRSGQNIKFLVAHTNTGNLTVVGPSDVTAAVVQRLVRDAIGNPCAVVEPRMIEHMASTFETWPPPAREEHQRWTPGFVLLCEGHASVAPLDPSKVGVFKVLDDATMLVYRRDRETPGGVLDNAPRSRAGGWGAISARVDGALGGVWTARSLSIGERLLELARATTVTRP